MKTVSLFLVFVIISFSGPLAAADEQKGHVCFRKIDANRDGKVTFEEFKAVFGDNREKFNQIDQDQDGKLSHDEYHKSLGHGRR